MNKQTLFFILFLSFLAALLGYNYFARPFENLSERFASPQVTENFDVVEELSLEEKLLSELTTKEKIAQLIAFSVVLEKPVDTKQLAASNSAWIKDNNPGFITLFGSSIVKQQAKDFKSKINNSESKIKIHLVVDHEGGVVQRLNGEGFTKLPSWQELCQMSDDEERSNLLASSSAELSSVGINVVLAPVVDLGINPVLGSRICSDDDQLVASRAAEYVSVFKNQSILPVLKHFPGIGKTSKDLHNDFDRVIVEKESTSIYKHLLDQFPHIGVMISHVGVKNQYPDIPCSLSRSCVKELSDNYPELLIFSDALDMNSALYDKNSDKLKTLEQVSIEAIDAGNNVLIYGQGIEVEKFDMILEVLLAAYESDSDFKNKVDRSVLKIINYKK
ncbi:MAG: glycoside hydrolase family 3 N-terminal domain-containing protein [Patescibacteria group bacterium]